VWADRLSSSKWQINGARRADADRLLVVAAVVPADRLVVVVAGRRAEQTHPRIVELADVLDQGVLGPVGHHHPLEALLGLRSEIPVDLVETAPSLRLEGGAVITEMRGADISTRVPYGSMTLPRTVGLFLGPYRNLTTLTAAVLHLHPHCQTLNHAAARVLDDPQLDFLVDHSPACLVRFCEFALAASQSGRRGNHGGTITVSHAFDHEVMRERYRARYGETMIKERVDAIVWKESLFVAKHLRERKVDVGALLAAHPPVRFFLPVRNPLDCAESNVRTGHARIWGGVPDLRATVEHILDEIAWVRDLARRHGEARFFTFFEFEVDATLPARLAAFLEIEPEARWIADSTACLDLTRGPAHDPALRDWYHARVDARFAGEPELGASLHRVVDYRDTAAR